MLGTMTDNPACVFLGKVKFFNLGKFNEKQDFTRLNYDNKHYFN